MLLNQFKGFHFWGWHDVNTPPKFRLPPKVSQSLCLDLQKEHYFVVDRTLALDIGILGTWEVSLTLNVKV